jgi:hypothetical protein
MSSLVVLVSLAGMGAATPPLPQAQTDPCATNPNGPKCVGRWMEPIELCGQDGPIGCNAISAECSQPSPCNTGCENGDEVAHAALIPSGPHAGQILVWTRCDRPTQNPSFGSYVWDPVSQLVTAEAAFPPGAADAFCAGHTWVLDAAGKAKLFVVGGSLTNSRTRCTPSRSTGRPTSTLYYSGRPSLTNVPATIHYPNGTTPNTFCVLTNAVWIKKAVLIGVGSVTHHFDYGQRYVELMVRGSQCGANNLEILPPVKSSLAPPGYYLLFLIDGFGLPSVGRLVKLDYQRP